MHAFDEIAQRLEGYTERIAVGFIDLYAKIKQAVSDLHLWAPQSDETLLNFAGELALIAAEHGFTVESCAEKIDLQAVGIHHGSCIDKDLIEEIIGYDLTASKDKNQRPECGCFEGIDIGAYHTCRNGCKYCYASFNTMRVSQQIKQYNPNSPLLCDSIVPEDAVKVRKVKSLRYQL